ncbi:phospholipase D family protein [Geomesophilobacter sediminis]|uniref:Phospholipase D family protein n=1 Tax=Geomesophilobacter sediminis TaxID=2798584 RepID=A0A8J7J981_9BACT|nr:phospholipase D family protein [Geomesophilobacter sediminis]MBJ6726371.1 phospholipase D family protein [Geomesophilobacter sediminis]
MLNPNSRCLYTSALTPPPGMIFDEAIATTFSMDPALLLEAPVYLALLAADGQTDPDPLSVLEAIRRYSKRITVYVQRGRIQVPQTAKPNPLFGFLEEMVIEVTAPGGGVFHPKVWAIRFVSTDKSSSMYRLVVLTRNMTTDQSWDLSLQLEGTIARRKYNSNRPLTHFFKLLPDLATGQTDAGRVEQSLRFAEDLHRVQWELPDGFDELTFHLPGTKGFDWNPPTANRMAVISPFCSDEVLRALVKQTKVADALISRPESLSALKKDTLQLFSKCLNLDAAAETEDGEEDDVAEQPFATGLHAKVYLFETRYYSDYTHVVMGSANATNAALNASKNIEILVGLVGRKNKVGGIDELLGADGLGEYLVDFDTMREAEIDAVRQEAEEFVERARSRISEVALSIECSPGSKDGLWALVLTGEIPSLEGIVSAFAWPITVTRDFAVDILDSDAHGGIRLGEFSASSVTGLIAFELKTNHPDVTARFVLNLPVTGVPEERNAAILQTVISNKDGFIRYLLLLLGDDSASGLDPGNGSGFAKWLARLTDGEDVPLLEELTRAYSRHSERLSEISGLVRDLSQGSQNAIIPEDFLNLWTVFESAIGGRDA